MKFLTNIILGLAFNSKNNYFITHNCIYYVKENFQNLCQKRKWALWMRHLVVCNAKWSVIEIFFYDMRYWYNIVTKHIDTLWLGKYFFILLRFHLLIIYIKVPFLKRKNYHFDTLFYKKPQVLKSLIGLLPSL
jgi:hypothetical protein